MRNLHQQPPSLPFSTALADPPHPPPPSGSVLPSSSNSSANTQFPNFQNTVEFLQDQNDALHLSMEKLTQQVQASQAAFENKISAQISSLQNTIVAAAFYRPSTQISPQTDLFLNQSSGSSTPHPPPLLWPSLSAPQQPTFPPTILPSQTSPLSGMSSSTTTYSVVTTPNHTTTPLPPPGFTSFSAPSQSTPPGFVSHPNSSQFPPRYNSNPPPNQEPPHYKAPKVELPRFNGKDVLG
ncbi:uncharacterized protein LOC126794180 [Argentina anserina]|uniref:uncharacterized protein LOC126794180 n=1 Tax=Argentina anserina TaxID=57926 RepID=UPI0021769311|nr:uncharacterized protein LOC126794180 [Potentilla anserina]